MISHPPARNGVRDQVPSPSPSILIGSPEDSILKTNHARVQVEKNLIGRDRCQITIDILPDDILLCIFHVFVKESRRREPWRTLVHVSRRWRTVVFESPHHLNLQLFCSFRTRVTKKLDMWPAFPIVVGCDYTENRTMDNVIAAIKHNDRVCKIELDDMSRRELEEVVPVMQVPFPALTDLDLVMIEELTTMRVIPDSFLGGSAPSLQRLQLARIPFPRLPKLLLSATDLVSLKLWDLPYSCYISPDTMVTCLSALARLKIFTLEFESPDRDWEMRRLPPPTPTLLPALTSLRFMGLCEYAEDLMARIDTPLLRRVYITSSIDTIPNIPHLPQFIYRMPKFQGRIQEIDDARLGFSEDEVRLTIRASGDQSLVLGMLWDGSVGDFSSLVRLCRPFLPTFDMVEQLFIHEDESLDRNWQEGIQHSRWVELLHLFASAKNIYLSQDIVSCISPILRQLARERTTEVLPALQNLFVSEYGQYWQRPFREDIEIFVAMRRFFGHPIAVSSW